MTGLLVSVRNASEARDALQGGASLIDVKEPQHGPLGAAEFKMIESIVAEIAGKVPISIALGELLDESPPFDRKILPRGIAYAKLGLAGCLDLPDWPSLLMELISSWPPSAIPVAVAYADNQRAQSPSAEAIIEASASLKCPMLLLDTFYKESGNLIDSLGPERLRAICKNARRSNLGLALAGSLDAVTMKGLADICPDWFAVRGAACQGGRKNKIDRSRVEALSRSLKPDFLQIF